VLDLGGARNVIVRATLAAAFGPLHMTMLLLRHPAQAVSNISSQ